MYPNLRSLFLPHNSIGSVALSIETKSLEQIIYIPLFFFQVCSFLLFFRRFLYLSLLDSVTRSIFETVYILLSASRLHCATMAPNHEQLKQARKNGSEDHELLGEKNEWKFYPPYKVHDDDSNFKALYDGSCHCGRVKYQLSREKPLASKYCHCNTCQVLHGTCFLSLLGHPLSPNNISFRCPIPMGGYFPQGRY